MSQVTELILRIKEQGGDQLTKLSSSFRSLGQQTAATNINFKELSKELKDVQQTSVNSVNNLRGYANAWREIANSVKIGSVEFKQATAEARQLESQLSKVSRRPTLKGAAQIAGTAAAAGIFGGPEGFLGAIAGGIIGGVPGAAVGAGIGGGISQVRQQVGATATYAADLSRQRQALQLVTKDAGEYQRALAFIDKTSRDLAIPQDLITRQFTQLTASVKGAGGNVRDAEKAFIGVASGIRGTGGSLEALDGALLATSQVFSKGKVSAEELRQQIGERLPGAFSLFAKSIGMTPQELDKALQNGQVSLQDFQKFADKLFIQYGENAKIIANGPDAAGDRLKTSLARLGESVGTLLKPIGAGFQNIFTDIINILDKAIRKFNEFAKVIGQKDYQRKKTELIELNQLIVQQEKAGAGAAQKGSILQEQYSRSLKKRQVLQAEIISYEMQSKQPPRTPEPPSTLPGIDTSKTGTTRKIPVQRLADLTSAAEEQRILAYKNLKLQDLIFQAKQKGYKYDEQVLPLLAPILQANTRIRIAQEKIVDLQKNKNILLKNGMSLEEYTVRMEVARDALAKQTLDKKAALKIFQQREFDISKQMFEEEVNARNEINSLIADAQLKGQILSAEDQRRVDINKALAQVIEQFAEKLTGPELLDAIRKLRQAMQGAAEASKDFGRNLARSFADAIKSTGDLANNLGSTLGNAFLSLGDQLAEFIATGKANFADFTSSVLMDMSKIFLRFAMFETLKALVPGSSALGKFLGFANGGIMTADGPMQLKRYAAGGIASSPQLAMFGEGSRPEAYVPLPDGRSIPVTMKGGGVGNVIVNVDAGGSSVEGNGPQANALGKAIGIAVQQELIKQKRPGGLLA